MDFRRMARGWAILKEEGTLEFMRLASRAMWHRAAEQWLYARWIRRNEPTRDQLQAMAQEVSGWSYQPMISVVVPIYNPRLDHLEECLESISRQIYPRWELCLADGGSTAPGIRALIEAFARADARVRVVSLPANRGIAGNSNAGVALATGEFVGFLDHDDLLAPFALSEVVKLLNMDPSIDAIYSDEDKVTASGRTRYEPYFKPELSPATLLSYNYVCHFFVVRLALLKEAGSFRAGYEGSQDYDVILRTMSRATGVAHIPKVLYHWRAAAGSTALRPEAKLYAYESAKRAISDHLASHRVAASVCDGPYRGTYRVCYRLADRPHTVSVIMTARGVQGLPQPQAVFPNLDLPAGVIRLHGLIINDAGGVRALQYDWVGGRWKAVDGGGGGETFPAWGNALVSRSESEHALFLDASLRLVDPNGLRAMIEHAQQIEVGAVTGQIRNPRGKIKQAGVTVEIDSADRLLLRTSPHPYPDAMFSLKTTTIQNRDAANADCLMIRCAVFRHIGGFDQSFREAYYDLDLCLRLKREGYRIIYTPYARFSEAPHRRQAGARRETPGVKADRTAFEQRWGDLLRQEDRRIATWDTRPTQEHMGGTLHGQSPPARRLAHGTR